MSSAANPTARGLPPARLSAASGGGRRAAVPAADADRIEPRRLIAFLAMVFGMFMAILDIQIVSASLTEIQAGLAASQQRDLLGADRLPDRRSGDDPAVGIPVAGVGDAHPVQHLGGRASRRRA